MQLKASATGLIGITGLTIMNAAGGKKGGDVSVVNGEYVARPASEVPREFAKVCDQNGWPVDQTWARLNGKTSIWYKYADESGAGAGSYVYFNNSDGKWWIDGPDGLGIFISQDEYTVKHGPPGGETAWKALDASQKLRLPTLVFTRGDGPQGGASSAGNKREL